MPDNLTIQIGADTSKVRGEIKLLQAQITEMGRGLRAAVRAGDTTGAGSISQNIGVMQAQLAGLNRTLRQTEGAGIAASRGIALTARSFRSLEGAVLGVGRSVAGSRAGIIGFAAVLGGKQVIDGINAVSESLTKLQETAREIGVKPIALQAAQEIAKTTGQSADTITKAMQNMGEAIRKARLEAAPTLGAAGAAGVPSVRDLSPGLTPGKSEFAGGVELLRGATKIAIDLDNALKMVGLDAQSVKLFPPTEVGELQAMQAALQKFQDLAKRMPAAQADAVSRLAFKAPGAEMLDQIPAQLEKLNAKIKELEESNRGASKATLDLNTQLKASQGNLASVFEELNARAFKTLAPDQIALNNWLANFITKTLPQFGTDVSSFFTNFWPQLQADLASSFQIFNDNLKNNFGQTLGQMAQSALDWAKSLGQTISGLISSTASTVGTALSNLPAAVGIPGGFASGGMVRGPGSATSDSILARLSNGEFVMSASAVQRWGAGLLASMNGGGGMPRMGRFAEGGLVTAGGTPVHLHLGGRSFTLAGSNDVVSALVSEAHWQQVRSAGVKPSWFAGRPSGR